MQNNDIDKTKLSSLARRLLSHLEKSFSANEYVSSFSDRLEVVIPGEHVEVGDMHVWVDSDEVIVGIGEHFHTHFATLFYETLSTDEAEAKVVEEALLFIKDFTDKKSILEITYYGNVPRATGVTYPDIVETYTKQGPLSLINLVRRVFKRNKFTKYYKWNGPWQG